MLLPIFTYFFFYLSLLTVFYCCCYVAVEETSQIIVLLCTIIWNKSNSESDSDIETGNGANALCPLPRVLAKA